ncbi:hypothetical protein [Rhodobacter sp. NSM]|uniref:hypothetical protein n=1 Tax=Rhodobacter sp. NSM TaxID=3457501 RepID=UPI003FD42E54
MEEIGRGTQGDRPPKPRSPAGGSIRHAFPGASSTERRLLMMKGHGGGRPSAPEGSGATAGRDAPEAGGCPGALLSGTAALGDGLSDALLLLLNALHVGEPEQGATSLVLGLKDGSLPSGALLGAISQLPRIRTLSRTLMPDGTVSSHSNPPNARPVARSSLRGIALLLQFERCGLAARGQARDDLVHACIAAARHLTHYETPAKTVQAYRARLKGAGLFESAAGTRAFIASVLAAMAGPGLDRMLARPEAPEQIGAFRAAAEARRRLLDDRLPEGLVRDALCSLLDFSHHSDAQISRTIRALAGVERHPMPDLGILPKLTADILPEGLLSGPSLPLPGGSRTVARGR